MRFFDAHCDTISKIHAKETDFEADGVPGGAHVTLPGLVRGSVRAQVFAVWAWRGAYGDRTRSVALESMATLRTLCAAHSAHLGLVRGAGDLRTAVEDSGRVAVIAGLEGADALEGDPVALRRFFDEGIRVLTPAWGDNEFIGSTFGDGGGLSPAGVEVVGLCEELGVVVDASHASDRAFVDLCRVAAKPFIASHSGCRSVCSNPRNLDDRMIRALAERGGVMGVNLGSSFLSEEFHRWVRGIRDEFFERVGADTAGFLEAQRASAAAQGRLPRPPLALVAEHVRHAIKVGGEDCVGLGGDLDGVKSLPEGLEGVADYPRIAELLAGAGLRPAQVEKVCFGNFARVFGELLP